MLPILSIVAVCFSNTLLLRQRIQTVVKYQDAGKEIPNNNPPT